MLNPNKIAEDIKNIAGKQVEAMSKDIILLNENQRSMMKNQQVILDHLNQRLDTIEKLIRKHD